MNEEIPRLSLFRVGFQVGYFGVWVIWDLWNTEYFAVEPSESWNTDTYDSRYHECHVNIDYF